MIAFQLEARNEEHMYRYRKAVKVEHQTDGSAKATEKHFSLEGLVVLLAVVSLMSDVRIEMIRAAAKRHKSRQEETDRAAEKVRREDEKRATEEAAELAKLKREARAAKEAEKKKKREKEREEWAKDHRLGDVAAMMKHRQAAEAERLEAVRFVSAACGLEKNDEEIAELLKAHNGDKRMAVAAWFASRI